MAGHKVSFELNNSVIALGIILFALGYFVGNVLPIIGSPGLNVGSMVQVNDAPNVADDAVQQQAAAQMKGLSVDGEPTMGNKDAKVIVYEFSDFQCPFCARFFQQTLPQLEQNYIDTGKILFVYKDFPLTQIHPGAVPGAAYANCAGEQGKWREMHDAIFNNQAVLQQGTTGLDGLATQLGLDIDKLRACVSSEATLKEIEADLQEGINNGVTGTPSFFIGSPEKGFVNVVGAQPYEVISAAIEQQLQ